MKNMLELAGALIMDKNKLLLMHRNSTNKVQWELPGGKLEIGENPEKAVVRELMEELNINVKIEKYLGYKEFEDNSIILKYHWYKCKITDNNEIPRLMEDKFDDLKYFTKKDLNNCTELSSNMKILKDTIDIEKI